MSAQIKKAGLKVTGPRMKILEIMERETTDNDRHLSATKTSAWPPCTAC